MTSTAHGEVGAPKHRRLLDVDADEPDLIERDPVRAAALGLIIAAVVIRFAIAMRGFLAADDYAIASQAMASPLTLGWAFHLYNNHLMPVGLTIMWFVARYLGLVYWPYAILLALGEFAVGVTWYRLLRDVIGRGWRVLVPLAIIMFSSLTLEATAWFVVGANIIPMQIAMALALGAMLKYVRTGRGQHLASLAGAMIFGLLFFEKSLLIAPLVFIATACLFVSGGPWRSLVRTITRFWPAWLVLVVVCGSYLSLYFRLAASSLKNPGSGDAVYIFLGQISARTVSTSVVGGPWRWFSAGDAAPGTDPPIAGTVAAVIAVVALIAGTMVARRRTGRAWLMAVLYLTLVGVLLSATRLRGVAPGFEGLVPRYISDATPVVALAIGVALFGLADAPARRLRIPRLPRKLVIPLALVAVLVVGAGTAYSFYGFANMWSIKYGRDYINTAEADLAKAPPGTVFFDDAVPERVLFGLFYPDTLLSHFFRPLPYRPTIVDETSSLSIFDENGHIHTATVAGVHAVPPADIKGCGYRVTGESIVGIPLTGPIYDWPWSVRVAYIASAATTAAITIGGVTRKIPIRPGVQQYFFHMTTGGSTVAISIADPKVTMCTYDVTIGVPSPAH